MTWKRKIPGEGACGPCCSWKERFDQLWDRAIGCITKINNITPDGDGKFEIRGGSNVQITDISNGIEISATGGSGEDIVKSVNGVLPDADGDVTIGTGVMTVNATAPDADGEFTISAGSNITLTPGTNSIEISAAGTILRKASVTLTAAGWNNSSQTVSVAGLAADEDVLVAADPSDYDDWNAAGIRAVSQAAGSITFDCSTAPTADLTANLVIGRLNV